MINKSPNSNITLHFRNSYYNLDFSLVIDTKLISMFRVCTNYFYYYNKITKSYEYFYNKAGTHYNDNNNDIITKWNTTLEEFEKLYNADFSQYKNE